MLSLDGFGSHLDPPSLVEFVKYKIMVLKEEGDTSQVSQAYDQKVAKDDKRWSRELLDGYKFHVKNTITQWELILVVNTALNKVCKGDAWKESFVKVNLCPSQRLPFKVWVKNIEEYVSAADCFFKTRTSLFDATPAVRQHMNEEERRKICSLFDTFSDVWSTVNLRQVMTLGFIKLDDIEKLRGCYFTAKEDSSMFVDPITPLEP